jgi:prophage regulatory protein
LANNTKSFINNRLYVSLAAHDAALSFTRENSMENVQDENRPVERLIRIGEVKRLTGVSTATLYRKIAAKEFPRPVRLGVVARAWPLSEVQDWIAGRIELRGGSND